MGLEAGAQPSQVTEAVKADTKHLPKANPEPDIKGKPRPGAEAGPASRPSATPDSDAQTPHEPQPPPESGSQPTAEPVSQIAAANGKVAALFGTKLGDVLLAEVLKDPAEAGRLISKAISDAELPATTAVPAGAKPITPAAPEPAPQAAE